jgi:hypothetical protein
MQSRVGRWLTVTLGLLLLAFGVAETVTHRDDSLGALAFWSGTLFGGATLILTGVLLWPGRPPAGFALVFAGALLGFLPTSWTILLPLLTLTVIVLAIRDVSRWATPPSSSGSA